MRCETQEKRCTSTSIQNNIIVVMHATDNTTITHNVLQNSTNNAHRRGCNPNVKFIFHLGMPTVSIHPQPFG